MASTTFELGSPTVIPPEAREYIAKELHKVAQLYTPALEVRCDVVEPKLTISVEQDEWFDIRAEHDYAWTMHCEHRRYNLGDKGADSPYEEVEVLDLDGIKITSDEADYITDCLEDILGDSALSDEKRDELQVEYDKAYLAIRRGDWRTEYRERADIALTAELYLYDHSGISISLGQFSCPWDSGRVGTAYITKAKLQEEFDGDEERAREALKAEVKEYDHCLQNNIWRFTVTDEDGNTVDSCCRFIGDDLEETGMWDHMPEGVTKEMLEEAWENRLNG